MKCRSQVLPLCANPAANGPWYQVVSNPVIPVPSRSRTSAAKLTTAAAAMARAIRVGDVDAPAGGSCQRIRGALRAELSSTPLILRHPPEERPRRDADSADRRAGRAAARRRRRYPSSSATQIRSASASTEVARWAGAPVKPGTSRRRAAVAPSQAKPTSSADLGDAQQVARRGRASVAAAQEADDLVELGDPQQPGGAQVGEPGRAPSAGAERDDLAAEAAPEGAVEHVPDAEADRGEGGGGDRDPDRAGEQAVELEAVEDPAQDHALGDDADRGRDRRRGDDPADPEVVEGERAERRHGQVAGGDRGRHPGPLEAEEGPGEEQEEAVGRQREGEPEERRRDQGRVCPAVNSPRW